jgi:AcrR family transcriptional regulator
MTDDIDIERRALLDFALMLVEQRTIRNFTLREVARGAGVSQAAARRHFADKAALLTALAEDGFRALTACMLAEHRASTSPAASSAAGTGYLLFAAKNPARYRVMFGRGADENVPRCATSAAGRESFQVLLEAIVDDQRRGLLRDDDAHELALVAWSIVHGLASLVIDGHVDVVRHGPEANPTAVRSLARRMLRLAFEGMAAR